MVTRLSWVSFFVIMHRNFIALKGQITQKMKIHPFAGRYVVDYGPQWTGILSLCETPQQFCALKNVTGASIDVGMCRKRVNYPRMSLKTQILHLRVWT